MYVRPESLENRTPYAGWSAKRDNKGLSQVLGTAAGRDILVLSYVGFVRSIGCEKKEVGRVAMPDNKAEKEKKESQYCTPYRLFFPLPWRRAAADTVPSRTEHFIKKFTTRRPMPHFTDMTFLGRRRNSPQAPIVMLMAAGVMADGDG